MKHLGWLAIGLLALAAAGCTSWDKYAAGQSQKYSGSPLFQMYEEWGTPVSRTRLLTGGRFYQFRKKATDCQASVWTNDLDIIVRMAVAGPGSCAAGW
ncbi:hypothetical protein [Dongia sedimenti]|uniref:Lipoprotein n=1 Tax=Dongia sedimenti TaxID=3064282 RepID=A0ABU0YNC7_9PROT|nr:hypothetical protein [Rhodospirillaceae bacterium R-7]